MKELSATVEILLNLRSSGWVTLRLSSGELDMGSELTCAETNEKYRVQAFSVGGGWQEHAAGYRTVQLTRVGNDEQDLDLAVGMHLVGSGGEDSH